MKNSVFKYAPVYMNARYIENLCNITIKITRFCVTSLVNARKCTYFDANTPHIVKNKCRKNP